MIICRTPFRISFFGGGTDYPAWYETNGGKVLSTAINKYCFLTVRELPPFFSYKHRIRYYSTEEVQTLDEIKHPAVRECMRYLEIDQGVEIVHTADIPARSGLGSSSSFTVCLLHALYSLKSTIPTKIQLAREAIHVEQQMIGENVGSQDQVAAAFGGLNRIKFGASSTIDVEALPLSPDRMRDFWDHTVLVFTKFTRTASEIAGEQLKHMDKKGPQLREMEAMVDEGISILLNANTPLEQFGELLHESWMLKRELSPIITNDEIDEIYSAALNAGASGGKLLGAGAGGFMVFFVKPENKSKLLQDLSKLLHVPVGPDHTGSHIVYYGQHA